MAFIAHISLLIPIGVLYLALYKAHREVKENRATIEMLLARQRAHEALSYSIAKTVEAMGQIKIKDQLGNNYDS